MPGFGKALGQEWAEATGDAAIGSRVTAGLADATPVFCLPDEPTAATLAAGELVAPDAAAIHHMASEN
jgi:molybdenum cofactor biosynthesis protein B